MIAFITNISPHIGEAETPFIFTKSDYLVTLFGGERFCGISGAEIPLVFIGTRRFSATITPRIFA
jgi:hypothetical protein